MWASWSCFECLGLGTITAGGNFLMSGETTSHRDLHSVVIPYLWKVQQTCRIVSLVREQEFKTWTCGRVFILQPDQELSGNHAMRFGIMYAKWLWFLLRNILNYCFKINPEFCYLSLPQMQNISVYIIMSRDKLEVSWVIQSFIHTLFSVLFWKNSVLFLKAVTFHLFCLVLVKVFHTWIVA